VAVSAPNSAETCAECATPLPAGARFCPGCGEPVESTTVVRERPEPTLYGVPPGRGLGERLAQARARMGSTLDSLAARRRAARDVVRLRQELLWIGQERRAQLTALGEAAYAEDAAGIEAGRQAVAALDERDQRVRAELDQVLEEARDRVEQARLEVQETQMIQPPQEPYPPPDEGTPPVPPATPEPYPPPDEGTPPQPPSVPEPGPEPRPGSSNPG
jgi:hypothetical protein